MRNRFLLCNPILVDGKGGASMHHFDRLILQLILCKLRERGISFPPNER
nr:MAG TPA: hypothetical protein [Caudoviricetes sp.]